MTTGEELTSLSGALDWILLAALDLQVVQELDALKKVDLD